MLDKDLMKKKKKISVIKIIIILILVIIIAFLIYFVSLVFEIKEGIEKGEYITEDMKYQYLNMQRNNTEEVGRVELEDSFEPSMGSKNPIMTIVEFGDFACPKCKSFSPILRKFVIDNSDKVKLIYRDLPILDTDYSLLAFANCANYQDKFWQMHDKLLEYQDQENLTTDLKDTILESIGLDKEKFNKCIENKEYQIDVQKDVLLANKLRLNGTPINFINGIKIEGTRTIDELKQILYAIENYK